jgi:crotonobetainyl-CoA:carnitine CoA-transferase CaiB-like acyl-CoA transferase
MEHSHFVYNVQNSIWGVGMAGSLEGLRVLDLSSHLSGPYCGMLLADHGAEVTKIEKPDGGDEARAMPPFVSGESAPFMLWNRNKRSVTLDLKSRAGKDALFRLIDEADILIENYRPGTLGRLGFSWDAMSKRNPRLIVGSISGFGQTGPYRERGGFDLVTQGMSGLMSVCGPKDGPPFRLPIAISDVAAGMHLAVGILSAVEARHRTGKGQRVDVALLDSVVSFGVYEAAHFFATGERPARLGQSHRGSSPYEIFETSDGWITIGAAQQNFWEDLCDLLEASELKSDARFSTNAARLLNNEALVAILQHKVRENPSSYWLKRLHDLGIPSGPVLATDEILTDPHVLAREMVVGIGDRPNENMKTLGVVAKLSDTAGEVRFRAPLLGEHTKETLLKLGQD